MSRIFDALQKSESERSGAPSAPLSSLAMELLQIAEGQNEQVPAAVPTPSPDEFPTCRAEPVKGTRLVSLTDPEGLAAEKFRFLGVRLRQLQQAQGLKKLLVTSTISEEGKSVISANLAFTLARKNRQKVLLLEGDLRRPVMCARLGLGIRFTGLVEWLHSESSQLPGTYHLADTGVYLLPAGTPPENPLELIQLPKMAELLERLASTFDWVVIDSPPILPLADTSVWSRLADGILLVTRQGVTDRRELKRGVEALDEKKLLGMIVNSCDNIDHTNYYRRYSPVSSRSEQETV
ncbi:MAG TPA: CpsD/CapB family tyrosine-protein kinase [Terriglobales bacterium]|jgi:capsular exopolysaccharide synthesis family protein|nr:CpsD/CapB family tyrosine-protein kinase [Terriglobales bacterium]